MDTFSEDDFDRLVDANIVAGAGGGASDADVDEDRPSKLDGKWQPETLADAYADDSPIEFIVDGLLSVPSLSIIYGGPGTLK